MKRFFSFLIACILIMGCITIPSQAIEPYEPINQVIARATDQFRETIPANTIVTLGDSVSLDSGEIITYNCTYTPKAADIRFGYIGPDGLFHFLRGSNGSFNKGIRVSQRGVYTLAIKNSSDYSLTVEGTVNY